MGGCGSCHHRQRGSFWRRRRAGRGAGVRPAVCQPADLDAAGLEVLEELRGRHALDEHARQAHQRLFGEVVEHRDYTKGRSRGTYMHVHASALLEGL